MTQQLVIPALTLRNPEGSLDVAATAQYADRGARTKADFFIISGSTGLGWQGSHTERRQLITVWSQAVGPSRLIACCWDQDDISAACDMGIRPIALIHGPQDERPELAQIMSALAALPRGSFVYSHPRFSTMTFTPQIAERAPRHRMPSARCQAFQSHLRNAERGTVGCRRDVHAVARVIARHRRFDGRRCIRSRPRESCPPPNRAVPARPCFHTKRRRLNATRS